MPLCIIAVALLSAPTNAFVSPSKSARAASSSLPALPEFLDGILHPSASDEVLTAADYARQKFWFYFFAGSGAGGIGLSTLPSLFDEAGRARAAAGTGTTRGGAALDAGPLVGIYYDSDISSTDVADAVSKAPTAEFISSRADGARSYMASKGYIVQTDFLREMDAKRCNPLASYALFDAISSGKGGVVSPIDYEGKLAAYREGSSGGDVASTFVRDLNGFLAVKAVAFLGLVGALLCDFGLVAKAGVEGWLS